MPPKEDFVRRKTRKALKLSAHHAGVALSMLIEEGKIAAGDVARALERRKKIIKQLRARLSALEDVSGPAAHKLVNAGRSGIRRAAPRARKAISRAQRIARKAQGHYMAAVRPLSRGARVKTSRRSILASRLKKQIKRLIERQPAARVDYIEFFDSASLQRVVKVSRGTHMGLAVFVGKTRLIDNTRL